MALSTVAVAYNQNAFERDQLGDLVTVIYDVTVDSGGGNTYTTGGDPITTDLSDLFREIVAVQPSAVEGPGAAAAGADDADGIMVALYVPDSDNEGRIRFYQGGGAGANLAELTGGGAYPNDLSFQLVVLGRPATDEG